MHDGANAKAKARREVRRKEMRLGGLYVAAKAATHKDGHKKTAFFGGIWGASA